MKSAITILALMATLISQNSMGCPGGNMIALLDSQGGNEIATIIKSKKDGIPQVEFTLKPDVTLLKVQAEDLTACGEDVDPKCGRVLSVSSEKIYEVTLSSSNREYSYQNLDLTSIARSLCGEEVAPN